MNEKILVTLPSFTEAARQELELIGEVDCLTPTQTELLDIIHNYSVVLTGLGLTFNEAVLARASQLKILATVTTGLDHIDVAYAESNGIPVLSLKNETEFLDTITGTAELAFSIMLQLLRKTHLAYQAVIERGEWKREDYRGQSIYGKTLGIVGMGRLGKIMARGADGFRMNIIFADPYVSQENVPEYRKVSFEELLHESDIVSIHTHLTDETENLFCYEKFKKMKRSAVLINTARGKIVNEADLLVALEERLIYGYGTDVLAAELEFGENASGDPLVNYAKTHNNVIVFPHIGGMTSDSRIATDEFIVKKIAQNLNFKIII